MHQQLLLAIRSRQAETGRPSRLDKCNATNMHTDRMTSIRALIVH